MAEHLTESSTMSQPLTTSPPLDHTRPDLSNVQTQLATEAQRIIPDISGSVSNSSNESTLQSDQKLTYVPTTAPHAFVIPATNPATQPEGAIETKHLSNKPSIADADPPRSISPTEHHKVDEVSQSPGRVVNTIQEPSLTTSEEATRLSPEKPQPDKAVKFGVETPPGVLVKNLSDGSATTAIGIPTVGHQPSFAPVNQNGHASTNDHLRSESSKAISQDPLSQNFAPPADISETPKMASSIDVVGNVPNIVASSVEVTPSEEENQQISDAQKIDSLHEAEKQRCLEKEPNVQDNTEQSGRHQNTEATEGEPDPKRRKIDDASSENVSQTVVPDSDSEGLKDWKPQTTETESSMSEPQEVVSAKPPLRTTPAPVVNMLPMLRSSPVGVDSNGSVGRKIGASPDKNTGKRKFHTEPADDSRPKKRKKVSWAPQEDLVDVQHINTRMELIRSWDPEFEITLPFSPATLQMFKNMSEEQRKAEGHGQNVGVDSSEGSIPGTGGTMTAFEAARKKEHDMELERARKAREELQQKLNKMVAVHAWRKPSAIVLPTECRIDDDGIERYDLGDSAGSSMTRDANAQSPPSPLMGFNTGTNMVESSESRVRSFPLSDGSVDVADGDSNSPDSAVQEDINGDRDGADERYYRDSGQKLDNGRDNGVLRPGHGGNGTGPFGMRRHEAPMRDGAGGFNSGMGGFQGKDGTHLPPQAVQHLLSALQSTGLLSQTNGGNSERNISGKYGRGSNSNDRGIPGDAYRPLHDNGGPGSDGMMRDGNANGGRYREEERRRMHVPEDSSMGIGNGSVGGPPPPPPPGMIGHAGQLGGGFQQGVHGGMMEGFPFPMPPMPPPPMGLHPNMMPPPLPMGIPMPPMGMPMPFNMGPGPMGIGPGGAGMGGGKSGKSGKSGLGRGREVETITRPKMKGPKQRKKCKYYGTKQGCRDGSSCIFAHIP